MGAGRKAQKALTKAFKKIDDTTVPFTGGRKFGSYVSRKQRNTITEAEHLARIRKNKR